MRAQHETRFRCLQRIAVTSFCRDVSGRLIQRRSYHQAGPSRGLIIVPSAAHTELSHA